MFSPYGFLIDVLSSQVVRRLPGVRLLRRIAYKIAKPQGIVLVNCGGSKMYVNAKDKGLAPALLIRGVFEKSETELLPRLIRPGMVVVDVGANIGYFTLIAAKAAGEAGRVYAFEPEQNNYELLVRNADANACRNVTAVQKAVSNTCGNLQLFLEETNLAAHSLAQKNVAKGNGFVEVETVTLDQFFRGVDQRVDFIKMDVQGAEGFVIEGAQEILKNPGLKIMMEFWPKGLRNFGTDPPALLRKLQDEGFKIRVMGEPNQFLEERAMRSLVELCGDSDFRNLLLER